VNPVVAIRDLVVSYATTDGATRAVDGVSLAIGRGESVGIVGESGSGKSTLGMAIGRLLAPDATIEDGEIVVDGRPVAHCSAAELRALRRERLGFVFQNPMSALDPTMRVGRQVALALGTDAAPAVIEALLARVRLPDPVAVARRFPHELSGGMAQRVVIALAIARAPALLIADEPTASLDASIQGLILDLLLSLGRDSGASLVILSHDLRTVARRCRRVVVMYGGRIAEAGASGEVFGAPAHPYTRALIRAAAGNEGPGGRLEPIAGVPPVLRARASHCAFAPRCASAQPRCHAQRPAETVIGERVVACHFADAAALAPSPAFG
jgi:oligopeptide/dipeptide ABC transporter ATP-binding protein